MMRPITSVKDKRRQAGDRNETEEDEKRTKENAKEKLKTERQEEELKEYSLQVQPVQLLTLSERR